MTLLEQPFDYEGHLAACAQGDRKALQRLYQQEAARLLGVALRLVRERTLAEDLVHDAFLRIWTAAAHFDPARGSARGWMFSITRHLALNHLRNRAHDLPLAFEPGEPAAPVGFPDAALHGTRLHFCLEQLPPARRDCIVQAYVDGCSHAEIARRIDAPLGTVKAWIKRSLAALRECMG